VKPVRTVSERPILLRQPTRYPPEKVSKHKNKRIQGTGTFPGSTADKEIYGNLPYYWRIRSTTSLFAGNSNKYIKKM
jgi:hypothetical protein